MALILTDLIVAKNTAICGVMTIKFNSALDRLYPAH